MYYTENNHNKVVLRDFYLSRFENGPITEPCGTPEYLGRLFSDFVFYAYIYFFLFFSCFNLLVRISITITFYLLNASLGA